MFRPLGKNLLVKPLLKSEKTTKEGIIYDIVSENGVEPILGIILDIGDDAKDKGLEVGQKVCYSRGMQTALTVDASANEIVHFISVEYLLGVEKNERRD